MDRTPKVLLVEDAPHLRYAFGRLLRMQGYEVREANDGREALDCLRTYRPNLVLTDLMMPVMGGVELIGHIRANHDFDGVPIVAITADATEQAEYQARKAGAIDFITKPIDLPFLLERLDSLFKADEPGPGPGPGN
ncbi:response regulator [Tundrisphaera sp. TA3]|uniref:response regulator n=1 Tax=Tundrisphaera sp. TA3 TaxID=3435775 RepID=UPI003EB91577